jgi:hypothetical protein
MLPSVFWYHRLLAGGISVLKGLKRASMQAMLEEHHRPTKRSITKKSVLTAQLLLGGCFGE